MIDENCNLFWLNIFNMTKQHIFSAGSCAIENSYFGKQQKIEKADKMVAKTGL